MLVVSWSGIGRAGRQLERGMSYWSSVGTGRSCRSSVGAGYVILAVRWSG